LTSIAIGKNVKSYFINSWPSRFNVTQRNVLKPDIQEVQVSAYSHGLTA